MTEQTPPDEKVGYEPEDVDKSTLSSNEPEVLTEDARGQPALTFPIDAQLAGAVLVVCPKDLELSLVPVVKSVERNISNDILTGVELSVFGPERLSRSRLSRWKVFRDAADSKIIREAFQRHIAHMEFDRSTQIALGVIIIAQDSQNVSSRFRELADASDLAGLPVHFRGISFTPPRRDSPITITALDPGSGTERLDNLIIQVSKSILEHTQSSPTLVLPATLATEILGAGCIQSCDESKVASARLIEDEEAAAHTALVEATQRRDESAVSRRPGQPAFPMRSTDRYSITEQTPLRLAYIVVSVSEESRAKSVRKRITSLVMQLDRALTPQPGTVASRTWLVAAGQGETRDPKMRTTGTLEAGDVWKPTADYLDMDKTIGQVSKLLAENMVSYTRRSQELARPLVIFFMPSASLPGARCQSLYRKLKELADIGWIVTDDNALAASAEIDMTTLVTDKDDAVNELLFAIRCLTDVNTDWMAENRDLTKPPASEQTTM